MFAPLAVEHPLVVGERVDVVSCEELQILPLEDRELEVPRIGDQDRDDVRHVIVHGTQTLTGCSS